MTSESNRIDRFDEELYAHAQAAPSSEDAIRMTSLYLRYARRWLDGDFDGMLECLTERPVFEHYPQRRRITGRDASRLRAQRLAPLAAQLDPRRADAAPEVRAVGFGEDSMIHELSQTFTLPDGTRHRCYLATVVVFHGDAIAGERIYTDHRLETLIDGALGSDFVDVTGVTDVGDDGALLPEATLKSSNLSAAAEADAEALHCPAMTDAARRMPSPERAREMVAANMDYMQDFFDANWDQMLEHLAATPVFEAFPAAIRYEGAEATIARNRSYEMEDLDPREWTEDAHRITASCLSEDLMIHEFSTLFTAADGAKERSYMLAIIPYEGMKLIGERVYTDGAAGANPAAELKHLTGVTVL